jgi:hypothetical protein
MHEESVDEHSCLAMHQRALKADSPDLNPSHTILCRVTVSRLLSLSEPLFSYLQNGIG